MLQSDKRFLIDQQGNRNEVRVSADSFSHDVFLITPGSVSLDIRLVDTDSNYFPNDETEADLSRIFIATLNVQSGRLLNALPFLGNVNLKIDWGDETSETVTGDYPEHTYSTPGEYTVTVTGHADNMTLIHTNYPPVMYLNYMYNLISINSWGNLGLVNLDYACYRCLNLTSIETKPKYLFRNINSMMSMFFRCSKLKEIFEQIDAPLLESVSHLCDECPLLESISESLFKKCVNLKDISCVFQYCSSLTTVHVNLFSNNLLLENADYAFCYCSNLVNAPTFYYNTNILSFIATFGHCLNLIDVPDYCFNNSKAVEFMSTFVNCRSIHILPEHILNGATEALSFYGFLQESGLTEINPMLFNSCTKATHFMHAFSRTKIQSIPESLFSNNTQVISFAHAFLGIETLISIPANLFRYNVNATDFSYTFYECKLITQIPIGIFDYVKDSETTNFDFCFASTELISVDGNIFAHLTNLKSIEATFYGCKLNQLPENIFANNTKLETVSFVFSQNPFIAIPNLLFENNKLITSFSGSFFDCSSVQGTTPKGTDNLELWERVGQPVYPATINGLGCFCNDDQLSNYSSIPINWKTSPI
jgi:PKD repeat protein